MIVLTQPRSINNNKNIIMRNLSRLMFVVLAFCVSTIFVKGEILPYEIYGAGTGMQGSYVVEVVVTSKKSNVNDDELVKCAVHGVLFKGFVNEEKRQTQKPLAGSPMAEQQHPDFFNDFFESTYKSYGQPLSTSRRVTKVNKKEYKVKMTVTVSKDQLRKDLELAGVLKGLNSGF